MSRYYLLLSCSSAFLLSDTTPLPACGTRPTNVLSCSLINPNLDLTSRCPPGISPDPEATLLPYRTMAPARPALAQSESKARFFERLGLDDNNELHRRIYAMMKVSRTHASLPGDAECTNTRRRRRQSKPSNA